MCCYHQNTRTNVIQVLSDLVSLCLELTMVFKEGDLVWVHFRKERFPTKKARKLAPRGGGPFKVLQKIGDNVYVLDLPDDYGVSTTFNVNDLTLNEGEDEPPHDSWSNPLEEGEDDGGPSLETPIQAPSLDGPLTRSKAKKLQDKLASFISYLHHISNTLQGDDQLEPFNTLLTLETCPSSALDMSSSTLDISKADA